MWKVRAGVAAITRAEEACMVEEECSMAEEKKEVGVCMAEEVCIVVTRMVAKPRMTMKAGMRVQEHL
jgi:hypothetical protein